MRIALAALATLALCACGDEPPAPAPGAIATPPAPLGSFSAQPPALAPAARQYWQAYYDDMLGDPPAGYEAALAADDPAIAARAAVRLAEREAATGGRRRALELVARAIQLAPEDDQIRDAADRVQADLAAAPADVAEVRGPPIGTALPGAAPAVAAAFAAAEKLLARAHRVHMAPALESLSSAVKVKERTTEEAAAAYRAVAASGGVAAVAAEFRAGSLYHDLAVELVFDLPPELDPAVASRLRRTLRASAIGYLRQALAAYRRALAVPASEDARLWRAAAETHLRTAEQLLGGQ
ncbi:MAG: hypothetical protein K8W52_04205 [Deltaproteobacteria bacterium]|nr:hypothetical protein [Deltaproteobacteria bacterium]